MFRNKRYMTKGVEAEIPPELRQFMWKCIDSMPEPKDYFQVFRLKAVSNIQKITHITEAPKYHRKYEFINKNPITAKVYVIDDESHSTMLLAEEY